MRKNIDRKMETLRPANYHPVPAIRRHKLKSINGVQPQQKINASSSIAQKIDHAKPVVSSSLARNSPVTKVKKPTSPIVKKSDIKKKDMLSDDDDLYSKLTFDDTELSLEDEIFEELEKVAHDEAKLNAAIQNFDKILSEYKTKEVKKMMEVAKPSAIPKPLQKSKTCSIIESKCILKKKLQQQEDKKVNKPIRVENVESVTHAGYYQLTKSLWNLEDFDNFAKSARHHSPAARKTSEGTLSKAKSVWEVSSQSPRPTISRQSSISKIPIKSSSNLSTSMLQLNSSSITMVANQQNGAHHAMGRYNLSSKKSSVYASTLGLSSPFTNHPSSSQKAPLPSSSSAIRRSSLTAAKSSSSISNYAETKASLQRRNFMNSKTSLPKSALAKSEMSIHGKFTMKAQKSEQKKRDSNCSDTLLDKCLVKGQELLRKVEEFNDGSSNATKTSIVVRKRDYIAKPTQQLSKNQDASMHTKMRSVVNELNAITIENKKKSSSVVIRTSVKEVMPTLESCNVISEVVLGTESQESNDKLKEDYESDDSGHISNENEEVIAMELKKSPRKISEELLEIFEKKSQQQNSSSSSSSTSPQLASKAKVIELNHVNLIKSSMEIYPTCKSEVTIFIKQY